MPYHAKTIVVGCGNIIFKDDGYGPRDKYENVHTYSVEEPLHELSEKCEVVIVGCKLGEISTPDVEM